MLLTLAPTDTTAPKAVTADDRNTTFQAVEGNGQEARSGEQLLVAAYSVLWMILLVWLVSLWRKQSALNLRIDELDKAIDKAAAKAEQAGGR